MRLLYTKIPPPVVALVFAAFMWLASRVAGSLDLTFGIRLAMGLTLLLIGQSISILGIREFSKVKTTVNPLKPHAASVLVKCGIYRFTRNPMYVGLALTLLSWAAFLANWLALPLLPLFMLYITEFQIKPEERVLRSLFGSEYEGYCANVRRWL